MSSRTYIKIGISAAAIASLCSCVGPGLLSPITADIKAILMDPNIAKTLSHWTATADATNPELDFFYRVGIGVGTKGVTVRGSASGLSPYVWPGLAALAAAVTAALGAWLYMRSPSPAP
jgi:hypothetical protein